MDSFRLLLPDFLLILTGFVICRASALDRKVWDAVERLGYYLLFPVLLFTSILKSPLQPSQTVGLVLAAWGITTVGIALALSLGRWPGVPPRQHAAGAQIGYRFNSFVALALAERLDGQQGLAWMALLIAVCVPLCNVAAVWPLARHGGHAADPDRDVRPRLLAGGAGAFVIARCRDRCCISRARRQLERFLNPSLAGLADCSRRNRIRCCSWLQRFAMLRRPGAGTSRAKSAPPCTHLVSRRSGHPLAAHLHQVVFESEQRRQCCRKRSSYGSTAD